MFPVSVAVLNETVQSFKIALIRRVVDDAALLTLFSLKLCAASFQRVFFRHIDDLLEFGSSELNAPMFHVDSSGPSRKVCLM